MPHAQELEEAVIGALLLESEAFGRAKEIVSPEMFYDRRMGIVYEAVCRLAAGFKVIDMLTVMERLCSDGLLEEAGGAYGIARLTNNIVSSAHLEYHCRIIQQQYIRRKFIEICLQDVSLAFDGTEDIDDILYGNSKKMEILQEAVIGQSDIKPLSEIMNLTVEAMYRRKLLAEKGVQSGITTGLADLDRITGGWQKSDLVILAARPAMGKTAVALHFARKAAEAGTAVAMFSLEMSDVSLGNRLALSQTDVDSDRFRLGKLSQEEALAVENAASKLYHLPVYVDSNAAVTMGYIHSRCRMLKKKGKCAMIIIDYLQLAGEKGDRNRNRENEVSQMSREAKLIARELDVPVILLSQLSREVERRNNKVPVLADLRESGAIEQDADMVVFIHRPEYYDRNAEKGYGELIVSKYRNGKTGIVKFKYNESLTRIYDYDTRGYGSVVPAAECPF
jgi:replicative DNA helicase